MLYCDGEVKIMNDRQLQILKTVVETGSFSKAEEILFTSRQALQKQINSLESYVGFKLLIKTAKGTVLTAAGKKFVSGMSKIMQETTELINICKNESMQKDTLCVAAPFRPRLLTGTALNVFNDRYPNINVTITFTRSINSYNTIKLVQSGEIDIAEVFVETLHLENTHVVFSNYIDVPYHCLVLRSHPLAGKASLTLDMLTGYPIGIRKLENAPMIQAIKGQYPNADLSAFDNAEESISISMSKILNFCSNNGVFITRADFFADILPVNAIKLETDITGKCVLAHNDKPSANAIRFMESIYTASTP
jgi:DNA-binding transcriptional LysR family regulator